MNDKPVFNSPELRKAFEESRQEIESLRTNLDLVSRDIKSLEAMLNHNVIRISVSLKLPDDFLVSNKPASLVWGEVEGSDSWRLLFEVRHYDFEGNHRGTSIKPLIESTASIRIAVYGHLPEFLRLVACNVKVEPLRNRIDPEELGFDPGPEENVDISEQL
jgi:hypothetical protein